VAGVPAGFAGEPVEERHHLGAGDGVAGSEPTGRGTARDAGTGQPPDGVVEERPGWDVEEAVRQHLERRPHEPHRNSAICPRETTSRGRNRGGDPMPVVISARTIQATATA
jgi:hypothetical protein